MNITLNDDGTKGGEKMKDLNEIRDALYEIKRDTKRMQASTESERTALRVARLQIDSLVELLDIIQVNELA